MTIPSTLRPRDVNDHHGDHPGAVEYAAPRDRVAAIIGSSASSSSSSFLPLSSGGTWSTHHHRHVRANTKTGGATGGGAAGLSRNAAMAAMRSRGSSFGGGGGDVSGGGVMNGGGNGNGIVVGQDPLSAYVAAGEKLADSGGAVLADALVAAALHPLLSAVDTLAGTLSAAADDDHDDEHHHHDHHDPHPSLPDAAADASANAADAAAAKKATAADAAALRIAEDDRLRFQARMTLERVKQERYAATGENARHELYADVPHWLGRLSDELGALHGDERRRYESEAREATRPLLDAARALRERAATCEGALREATEAAVRRLRAEWGRDDAEVGVVCGVHIALKIRFDPPVT